MSKLFAALLTVSFLVGVSIPAIAEEMGTPATPATPAVEQQQGQPATPAIPAEPAKPPMMKHVKMMKSKMLSGTIASVDTLKNEIVLKEKSGMEKTIAIDPAEIGSLKANDRVMIVLKEGTMNVAANVKVLPMKKITPPKMPEVK
jgi:hypothetical protein